MAAIQKMEIPVQGMDCAECTQHVGHAIRELTGVQSVEVYLASEKAVVQFDPSLVDLPLIRRAVAGAGYEVSDTIAEPLSATQKLQDFTRPILTVFGIVFATVLFVVVVGEWLGWFEKITTLVPWPVGLAIVLLFGYPVFKNVVQASLRRQIISHTLMSLGVIAALVVGQWATAVVVVFFMRVGDYVEKFTTERARKAVRDLTGMEPEMARIEREGQEIEVPIEEVRVG